jgi:hypothetical protein
MNSIVDTEPQPVQALTVAPGSSDVIPHPGTGDAGDFSVGRYAGRTNFEATHVDFKGAVNRGWKDEQGDMAERHKARREKDQAARHAAIRQAALLKNREKADAITYPLPNAPLGSTGAKVSDIMATRTLSPPKQIRKKLD